MALMETAATNMSSAKVMRYNENIS